LIDMLITTFDEPGFDRSLHIDTPCGQVTRYLDIIMVSWISGKVFIEVADHNGQTASCNASSFANADVRIHYNHQINLLTIVENETKEKINYSYNIGQSCWVKGEENGQ
jgi:hypothetical protein